MSLAYTVMYRLGIRPWEHEPPQVLVDLIDGEDALPAGKMLDVGCGTAGDLIYAARHGWKCTGVDAVPRALDLAQKNAQAAAVDIRLVQADITSVDADTLGEQYTFVLDGGCLHGLTPEQRRQAGAKITAATEPGAVLVMLAFSPARRGPLPHGIDASDVSAMFPHWDLTSARPATDVQLKGPLRNAKPMWFQLRRQ